MLENSLKDLISNAHFEHRLRLLASLFLQLQIHTRRGTQRAHKKNTVILNMLRHFCTLLRAEILKRQGVQRDNNNKKNKNNDILSGCNFQLTL